MHDSFLSSLGWLSHLDTWCLLWCFSFYFNFFVCLRFDLIFQCKWFVVIWISIKKKFVPPFGRCCRFALLLSLCDWYFLLFFVYLKFDFCLICTRVCVPRHFYSALAMHFHLNVIIFSIFMAATRFFSICRCFFGSFCVI